MKVVSGHQPVYLPWLGLIHKAKLSDVFIYMDDVQYLSEDWNNRNRIKTAQGQPLWLTVPVDLKNSVTKTLKDILIATENVPEKKQWQNKHFLSLQSSYARAPFYKEYLPFFQWLYLEQKWEKLSDLNLAILKQIFDWFKISTELIIASEMNFQGIKSDLVLEHGLKFAADIVLTGMHGKDYIQVDQFREKGIRVIFQEYKHPTYEQRFGPFVSHLSFVDLLFQYGPEAEEICLSGNLTRNELEACS